MKPITFASLVLALSFLCWKANAQMPAPLNSNDMAAVRLFLANVDSPHPDFKQMDASMGDPGFRKSAMAYYLAGTNAISDNGKLMFGILFAQEKRFTDAIKLLEEHLKAFPTNWDGLNALGRCLVETGAYGRAIGVLTNAAEHTGNSDRALAVSRMVQTQAALAYAAIFAGRPEIVKRAAPYLDDATPDQFSTPSVHQGAALALIVYSISAHEQGMFIKGVQMLDPQHLPTNNIYEDFIQLGCYIFKVEDKVASFVPLLQRYTESEVPYPGKPRPIPITSEETELVRGRLKENDAGTLDLYSAQDDEFCRQLMAYYLDPTNVVSPKAKLAISRCFAKDGQYAEAIKLADEYVQVFSNDWRGWRMIGAASYRAKALGKVYTAYSKVIALGGPQTYDILLPLAESEFWTGHFDMMGAIVPGLLKLRQGDQYQHLATIRLLSYAIMRNDEKLFVQTVEGITSKEMQSSDADERLLLFIGWNLFHPKEMEARWKAYQEAANFSNEASK